MKEEDFVAELGYLALAVRMKRISESVLHSGRQLYKELGIDIEPNWYLLFLLLQKYEALSITEIAGYLGFAHPSVINIVNKMKNRSYLESHTDSQDSRRQIITLSPKALLELPRLNEVWEAAERGIRKAFPPGDNFLEQLALIEQQNQKLDFMKRTIKELKND